MNGIEVWWPIANAVAIYDVSNHGRVRSCSRVVMDKHGQKRIVWSRVLKTTTNENGFKQLCLVIDRKRVCKRVNRLVLEAFRGPPPSSQHQARYLDGDRTNNSANNLRWMLRGNLK